MNSPHKKMGKWEADVISRAASVGLHWFHAVYFQTFQLVGVVEKLPAIVGCF